MEGDVPAGDEPAAADKALPQVAGLARSRGWARRRVLMAAGAGLGLFGLASVGAILRRPSAGHAPAGSRPVATATVERQTLVGVTTAQANLAYGPERTIESRLAGTVTALAPVGTVVGRGKVLFRIDDTPVVLLYGTLPAFRDLTAGDAAATGGSGSGAGGTGRQAAGPGAADPSPSPVPASRGSDVKQFEQNLRALGYTGITVDEQYTGQTASAVRRWQKDLGLPQTGAVELGRVFYAAGPVRVARHILAAGAVTSGPVLAVTSAVRLVTAKLPAHGQALAKVGTKVAVALPSGKEVPGTVTSVGTPAGGETDGVREPTLEVVVTLDDPASVDGLDDGPAQVRFTAQERRDVLVVPVGALLALAEGGYGLEVVEGDSTRVVAVTTGLFANGKVEVSGPDIRDGMTVGMAR